MNYTKPRDLVKGEGREKTQLSLGGISSVGGKNRNCDSDRWRYIMQRLQQTRSAKRVGGEELLQAYNCLH